MRNICYQALLIASAAVIWGCGTSPLARYPDLPGRKKEIKSTVILSDFVVIEAQTGDTAIVDLPENKRKAQMCLNMLAGELNGKGYQVDRTHLSSVGLLMNAKGQYKVVHNAQDRELEADLLPIGQPPFYISDHYGRDTLVLMLLSSVYNSLINYEKRKGDKNAMVPAAVYLGKEIGGGTMIILLVGGCNVGISRQAGIPLSPHGMRYDKVGVQAVSQATMMLYIIDTATGEVIWDDRQTATGGQVHDEKLIRMLKKITDELP